MPICENSTTRHVFPACLTLAGGASFPICQARRHNSRNYGRCIHFGARRGYGHDRSGRAGGMGGAVSPASRRRLDHRGVSTGTAAVRVLRAGLDRGLAGSGDVAGAAAGTGRGTGTRSRADRGGVLRCGGEPDGGVGAAPAVRRAGRPASRSGPGVGRDRDRGVRAGVLRQPVRGDGPFVRALRCRAVDAGDRRPGRLPV
jgi:hypothetical protein